MLPTHATTPSTLPGETYFGYTFVPITDEDCWIYTYAWNPARPLTNAEREKFATGHGVIAEVDRTTCRCATRPTATSATSRT